MPLLKNFFVQFISNDMCHFTQEWLKCKGYLKINMKELNLRREMV